MVNHYSRELPGYETNLEKASELASDEVILECPQQQEPNLQMASLTCTYIVIHPEHLPYHLNATHSNIFFGITLRNLAKKRHHVPEQHVLEQVVPEQITEPDFMIISYSSNNRDEQTNSWFKPRFLNKSASSSSTMISESVSDQPFETNTLFAEPDLSSETSTNDQPSSSNQAIQTSTPARTKNVLTPRTLFLDSTILADMCENIFQELNNLVEARNKLFHEESYVKQWRRLRERVDFVLSELQRSSFDAQGMTQNNLQDWLRGVVNNLQEVAVSRTLVKTPLCLLSRDVIPTSIHPRELDTSWLTKINLKQVSTELEFLQRNPELERENKQLKEELLDQKLLLLEYKTSTYAKLEEARIREENLMKSNNEF